MQSPNQYASAKISYFLGIGYVIGGAVILFFAKDLLVPLSFAVLISFVLYPVCTWLERKGCSSIVAIIISLALLLVLAVLLIALLFSQLFSFWQEWPALQTKLIQSFDEFRNVLTNVFGLSAGQQQNIFSKFMDQSGTNLLGMARGLISFSAVTVVLLILIPIYSILILYYRKYWMKILHRLFPKESKEGLTKLITLTIKAYHNFIKGMAVVYLIVGTLNSIGLLVLGVPHAILFGFIASILTFVPYVGIMIGSLLPMTMAWITYDSIWYPVGIVAVFTFVQYLEANVIFPIAVSSRLNVNTMVMLLSIFAGGLLWGMAGMILFVPFVGIAKLIADHNPKWKTMSMILGIEKSN